MQDFWRWVCIVTTSYLWVTRFHHMMTDKSVTKKIKKKRQGGTMLRHVMTFSYYRYTVLFLLVVVSSSREKCDDVLSSTYLSIWHWIWTSPFMHLSPKVRTKSRLTIQLLLLGMKPLQAIIPHYTRDLKSHTMVVIPCSVHQIENDICPSSGRTWAAKPIRLNHFTLTALSASCQKHISLPYLR